MTQVYTDLAPVFADPGTGRSPPCCAPRRLGPDALFLHPRGGLTFTYGETLAGAEAVASALPPPAPAG